MGITCAPYTTGAVLEGLGANVMYGHAPVNTAVSLTVGRCKLNPVLKALGLSSCKLNPGLKAALGLSSCKLNPGLKAALGFSSVDPGAESAWFQGFSSSN